MLAGLISCPKIDYEAWQAIDEPQFGLVYLPSVFFACVKEYRPYVYRFLVKVHIYRFYAVQLE